MVQQCGQDQNGNANCVMVPQSQIAQQVQQPQYQQPQQVYQSSPVIVQQPVVVDNSGAALATGVAIGMLAHPMNNGYYGGSGSYHDNRTIINVHNHPAPIIAVPVRPSTSMYIPPKPSYVAPRPTSFSAPRPTASYGGFSKRR